MTENITIAVPARDAIEAEARAAVLRELREWVLCGIIPTEQCYCEHDRRGTESIYLNRAAVLA